MLPWWLGMRASDPKCQENTITFSTTVSRPGESTNWDSMRFYRANALPCPPGLASEPGKVMAISCWLSWLGEHQLVHRALGTIKQSLEARRHGQGPSTLRSRCAKGAVLWHGMLIYYRSSYLSYIALYYITSVFCFPKHLFASCIWGLRDGKFVSGVCFAGLFRGMFRGSVSHSSSTSHS